LTGAFSPHAFRRAWHDPLFLESMNLQTKDSKTLEVTGIKELSGAVAGTVRDTIKNALTDSHTALDIELSEARFIDSSGLGALISLHKTMSARQGQVRLVNPSPMCRQLLELTRLHRTFEIVTR
jgi:anti-sigma B factor antagonist